MSTSKTDWLASALILGGYVLPYPTDLTKDDMMGRPTMAQLNHDGANESKVTHPEPRLFPLPLEQAQVYPSDTAFLCPPAEPASQRHMRR